jgi:sortase B
MAKKLRLLIIIAAAVVLVVSAGKIAWYYYQLYVADKSYANIIDAAVEEEDVSAVDEFSTLSLDFDALYAINPDIVAWLYIPDTPVSYPILCGRDNQTYLQRTFDRKPNILGSIFQDYRNDKEFQDWNTVIYGHNTKSDKMFGSLKKYKNQEYADDHLIVHIIRKDDVRVYEIFTVYETLATSNTYTIKFGSDESYLDYVKEMASKTIVSAGSQPENGEYIITLSTCTGGQKIMRLVLQAKLIEVHNLDAG